MPTSLRRETRWCCPNCTYTDVTHDTKPHSRMHPCRGAYGLTMPMVEAGVDCKVITTEREDYVAGELVRTDGRGRPIMNSQVVRADGSNDVYVYAPTALGRRSTPHD